MSTSDAHNWVKARDRWGTCFVSAPAGLDLQELTETLKQVGIKDVITSLPTPTSTSIIQEIIGAITRADLVIGYLQEGLDNSSVYFELGIAKTLRKEVLVFVSSGLRIPDFIESLPYYRSSRFGREIYLSIFEQFARISPLKEFQFKKPLSSRPLGLESTTYLRQLDDLKLHYQVSKTFGRDIIELLSNILTSSGTKIISTSYLMVRELAGPDLRADMAVWSDDLTNSVGNPLLIEIKYKLRVPIDLEPTLVKLHARFPGTPRFLLLIYVDGPPTSEVMKTTPFPILPIRLDELIERLKDESFTQIVINLRNKSVHGVL